MKLPLPQIGDLQPRWTQEFGENAAQAGTAVIREATKTLVERFTLKPSTSSGSSSSGGTKCAPGDDSGLCQKPTGESTQTLPIVLGVVIPVTCATVVLLYLHRRNKKRQAIEDLNDPHKSLDFGMDLSMQKPPESKKRGFGGRRGNKEGGPEMIVTDLTPDPTRPGKTRGGLSLDMLGSPYMMPPGMRSSQESLHSMTRSMPEENDPYRPVTQMRSSQDTSRSPRPFRDRDNGSTYSSSTVQTGVHDKSNLIGNAQRMSQSYPARSASLTRTETNQSEDVYLRTGPSVGRSRSTSRTSLEKQTSHTSEKSNLSPIPSPGEKGEEQEFTFPLPPEPPVEDTKPPPRMSSMSQNFPARKSSTGLGLTISVDRPMSDASYYEDDDPAPLPPPKINTPDDGDGEFDLQDYDIDPSMIYTDRFSVDNAAAAQQHPIPNNRMSMMGLRPLPPENPEENAEQRANRIRSFYKEYFDDSRPNPANAYYEDFEANYADYYYYAENGYGPGEYYPPQAPYAQPMGRRAMTPPPGGAGGRHAPDGRGRFSSMSAGAGARGPFRGRAPPPPKKKLPPPVVLSGLPTPHLLKSDSALLNTVEFAPPASFREMQNGRAPDSPKGVQRPYSPAVRAYSPLVSTFEGLNPLPSPHQLRKSGTFTTLDFSPQMPRFLGKEGGGGSDAGSIRSARSGISAMHKDAIKTGAYRISRIPKEMVTTKDDLSAQLKPKMDLTSYA